MFSFSTVFKIFMKCVCKVQSRYQSKLKVVIGMKKFNWIILSVTTCILTFTFQLSYDLWYTTCMYFAEWIAYLKVCKNERWENTHYCIRGALLELVTLWENMNKFANNTRQSYSLNSFVVCFFKNRKMLKINFFRMSSVLFGKSFVNGWWIM